MALFSLKDQQSGATVLFTALDLLNLLAGSESVNDELIINNRSYRLSSFKEIDNGNGGDADFDGNRFITRNVEGLLGFNPAAGKISDFLEKVFYPSVPPELEFYIEGGNVREYGANNLMHLHWRVTMHTAPITSITVANTSVIPNGGAQAGQLAIPATQNVATTVTLIVVADKTVQRSLTLNWRNRRYWGTTAKTSVPTDLDILLCQSELATDLQNGYDGFNALGNYIMFAWPSEFGEPHFIINGMTNTSFIKVRDHSPFRNQFGYITAYDVWKSPSPSYGPIISFQIT